MLDQAEVTEFRKRVSTAHQRRSVRGPIEWIRYSGGPLDGIRTLIERWELSMKYFGWCHVLHDGPVLALYVGTGEPNVVRFLEWSAPERR